MVSEYGSEIQGRVMSNTALAVGVAISGVFVLIIVGVVILICVLNKRTPRRRKKVRHVKQGTENIKRKAEKLKADKSKSPCCAFCRRTNKGPCPDPPFGVELQDPSSSELTILWNEPKTELNAVPILGYKIYKRFSAYPDDWVKVGKVASDEMEFRIKDLTPNKRYVFGVSTVGKNGDSTIVETQPTTLKKDPVRPGAPIELDVTDRTSSSMMLSWKPPKKGGYSRIHTYYVTMKDCEGNSDWKPTTTLPAFDRFMDFRVTGLTPKHSYRFRVNAENSVGLGPHAETITYETTEVEPDPPEKPKGPIKYSKISHSSITLSWRPPDKDGGKPISGYAVEQKEKKETVWHKAGVSEADKTRLTVSGLQEDIEYVFRVIAINIVGNSKPLVGGRVRTKLLEIPLSRRSSFRLPSRSGTSRDSSRGRPSVGNAFGKDENQAMADIDGNNLRNKLENLDIQLEADPFVPKSDFFTYDETDSGNISNRHGDNKTRHSDFSPLPKPPPSDLTGSERRRSGATEFGAKHRHSDYSPLPKPTSYEYRNGRLRHQVESDGESGDEGNDSGGDYTEGYGNADNRRRVQGYDTDKTNTESSILTDLPNFKGQGGVIRRQELTPSNIAYKHSRY